MIQQNILLGWKRYIMSFICVSPQDFLTCISHSFYTKDIRLSSSDRGELVHQGWQAAGMKGTHDPPLYRKHQTVLTSCRIYLPYYHVRKSFLPNVYPILFRDWTKAHLYNMFINNSRSHVLWTVSSPRELHYHVRKRSLEVVSVFI